ncbi:MAG TPA: helix-turn-helix transcriptional regulator [Solirubrobacteraceae bacterium]|jgi:transcriptional regulator with XRE-family HTH domain
MTEDTFAETFAQIRKRRRIPLRFFEEHAGLKASYVHDVERGALLPSTEKFAALLRVLREVAVDQGAADPDEDGRRLFRERERVVLVQRHGVEPELAEAIIDLRALDLGQREDIAEPLRAAVELFAGLDVQQRRAVARTVVQAAQALLARAPEERARLGSHMQKGILDALTARGAADDGLSVPPQPRQSPPASSPRARTSARSRRA